MTTLTAERQELYKMIDTLPDDSVIAMRDLIRSLRSGIKAQEVTDEAAQDNDDGFYDEANVRWLKGSIEQLKQGKVVVKTIEELESMADE